MSEVKVGGYVRVHSNNLIGMVDRLEFPDGNPPVYSGGTLLANTAGSLRYGLRSFVDATTYADAEARKQGHKCDQYCGGWPHEEDS